MGDENDDKKKISLNELAKRNKQDPGFRKKAANAKAAQQKKVEEARKELAKQAEEEAARKKEEEAARRRSSGLSGTDLLNSPRSNKNRGR